MKKKLLLLPFAAVLVYITMCSYTGGAGSTGGIDGTGASTTLGCNTGSCHTHATTTAVTLELDTVGGGIRTQYIAGGVYTVKITGTNNSTSSLPRFGFQIAVVKSAGFGTSSATNAGTLASTGLPASTHFTASGTLGLPISLVEHSSPILATTGTGGLGSTYVETIGWTAPATSGTGTIMLSGAINAVNFDGSTSGDAWNNNNATITEYVPITPITGTPTVCVGASTPLSDTYIGGTWGSSVTSVATVSTSGVVTGIAPGTTVITDVEGSTGTASMTVTVIAPPVAGTISGSVTVCQGANILLTDAGGTTGGTWSSTTPSIATVNSVAGVVHGIAGGTDSIKYTVTNGCGSAAAVYTLTVNPLPATGTISGNLHVCMPATETYTETVTGGTWSMTNANAMIATDGTVTGVTAGADTIRYAVTNSCGTAYATKGIIISAPPVAGPITGPSTICTGTPQTYTGANTGGFWTAIPTSVATVNLISGAVTGVTTGTVTLQYVLNNACGTDTARTIITVTNSPSAGSITGAAGLCVGANTTLVDVAGSGTWSSDNGNATVTSLGVVNGVAAGTDSIRYTVTNSCGTAVAIHALLISNTPDAGTISGPSTVCQGATISLSETATGGTWSESSSGFTASVSTMGVVTGNNGGADVINYTVSNGCGSVTATYPVTVNPLPSPGVITGGPAVVCAGSSVTLVDTTSGGIWSASDTNVTVVGGVVTATSGGADTIFYSVTNSCGTVSATTFVLVNSGATAGVIMGDGAVCVDSAIILTDSLPGGAWSLSNGNALISGGVLVGVTPGFDTVYYSLVTGCGLATAAEVIDIMPAGSCGPLAVNNVANTGVKVYPNPSNGAFTIELPQSVSNATITITDVMGKVVADRNVTAAKSAIVSFDLSGLAAGNYIMKVDAGAKIYREQITIAK